jgi:preprotein translocase subunit SecF
MLDLEKILVKIVLLLVTALFIVLLFNSCKSHKNIVKMQIDSTATEIVKVESHTTDNSKTQEEYTEITYVLDSGQIVTIGKSVTNCNQLRVSQIKVKNSHVSHENDINNKTYATEEKTAEIKEKSTQIEKTKPNATKNLRLVAVVFVSIVILLALWRFYSKI